MSQVQSSNEEEFWNHGETEKDSLKKKLINWDNYACN